MDEDADNLPSLYFDLGSPYSWLAFERSAQVLGLKPRLEPILIGGIFQLRGWGSWSQTEARAENIGEIERRADLYGIGPVQWPCDWPDNTLLAMRCSVAADREGALEAFTSVAFHAAFREGRDLSDEQVLAGLAEQAGLDPKGTLEAALSDEVKADLRTRTERAWQLGVKGAPTVTIGERIFYGDDQIELAANALRVQDQRR